MDQCGGSERAAAHHGGPHCAERKDSMLDHGQIDLHTHILPQTDDGSPEKKLSAELLHRGKEQRDRLVQSTSRLDAVDWNVVQRIGRHTEEAVS